MSLSERLKKKVCPKEVVTIGDEKFIVSGKSLADTAALMAKARKKDGRLDGDLLDKILLAACVSDPDDGSSMSADEWGDVPRAFTGPLMSVIFSVLGLDKDDVQRDPKGSDSTAS